ncbi:MAG: hypothetical protein DMD27_09645 [Gemmatimonadetes bacterium]|nr:MAG: hypothetical protein DMD27_09645 [Gemmatimonadota bacterium]
MRRPETERRWLRERRSEALRRSKRHQDHVPPPVAYDPAAEIPPPIPPAPPRPFASDRVVWHVISD